MVYINIQGEGERADKRIIYTLSTEVDNCVKKAYAGVGKKEVFEWKIRRP